MFRTLGFPSFRKGFLLAGLVFLFFLFMSRIDYIVNGTLYSYGLKFSYGWANDYWITYNLVFVVFSAMVAVTYWVGSKKTAGDMKISAALFATVSLLALGGLQDILFFVLWGGGLPANSVVWWWTPWVSIVGTWNSLAQVSFTILTICASAGAWVMVFRRQSGVKAKLNS